LALASASSMKPGRYLDRYLAAIGLASSTGPILLATESQKG
jgi:hypothetical protein